MIRGKGNIILVFILLVAILAGCSGRKPAKSDEKTGAVEETGTLSMEGDKSTAGTGYDTRDLVAELSDKLIQAIMKKDASALATYVHPVKGLRISPYGCVQLQTDPVFDTARVKTLFSSNDKIDWGVTDEDGKAELLTVTQYFDRYLVSKYAAPGTRATDEDLDGSNITETYGDSIAIEHMCGEQKDGAYDNLIILVYENYQDKWHLTGIVPVIVEN